MSEIKLFYVTSTADLRGCKDVPIAWFVTERERHLFGPGGSLDLEVRDAIPDYTGDHHGYDRADRLEEYFTADEAKALTDWLATHHKCPTTIEPVQFPQPDNTLSLRAVPIGGGTDFLTIGDSPDYDLPFKSWGYYDVRGCHRADAEVAR
jgi:hypothetical protein